MPHYFHVLRTWAIRSKLLFIGISLASLLALSGCGQTGPLYLPDEKPGENQQPNN
ncbi:LPS translocon maturation chaperone LptM [Sessilibacter corallicola]|uniref:LPS translocon maturation chaperone LptM n=1 Tax=Sessilibacter corallicola TaxID=2904075 RepID=UPI003DA732A5